MRQPDLIRCLTLAAACCLATAGCFSAPEQPAPVAAAPDASSIRFRDLAAEAGVDFRLGYDRDPSQLNISQMSSGGAGVLDADGDGRLDLILTGYDRLALYRSTADFRYEDVTARSGLRPMHAGMGVAAADYDNDGRTDLLLTGLHGARLYRNLGGRFQEVTQQAGLRGGGWFTSAAFADFDNDGLLDLYIGGYVRFSSASRQQCPVGVGPQGQVLMGPCGPDPYPAAPGVCYRNLGGGRFKDVTRAWGLHRAGGKTLGVAPCDYDADGYMDLYLANDRVACDLFLNLKGRGFRPVGVETGTAYSRDGQVQGGMGAAWGDYNRDGRFDLLVGTYQNEPKSLYTGQEGGHFVEASLRAGLAPAQPRVTFGAGLADFDLDGWEDILLVNGHVLGRIELADPALSYAQPMQIFRGRGDGSFAGVSGSAGEPFQRSIVGRAAAFADLDADGLTDLLVADLEGRTLLLRNESKSENRWLRIRLRGEAGPAGGRGLSNRQGIGALVRIRDGAGLRSTQLMPSYSYLAACEDTIRVGFGRSADPPSLEVRWPSGRISRVTPREWNREILIQEIEAHAANE